MSERSQMHRTNVLEQELLLLKTNSNEEIVLLLPSLLFEISSGHTTLLHFPSEIAAFCCYLLPFVFWKFPIYSCVLMVSELMNLG